MMQHMKRDDIKHLGTLSRIELTETEIDDFTKEISAILDYVSVVQDIVAEDEGETMPDLGARYNVFREDVVTNQPDSYTEEILAEMPRKQGRYLEVKKILNTDSN